MTRTRTVTVQAPPVQGRGWGGSSDGSGSMPGAALCAERASSCLALEREGRMLATASLRHPQRLVQVEPPVVQRAAGDHAFDPVADIAGQRRDVADVRHATAGD